jgi:hypothetical protein
VGAADVEYPEKYKIEIRSLENCELSRGYIAGVRKELNFLRATGQRVQCVGLR